MIRDDISAVLKEAMKARDERKVSTLRMVNSVLKNADIEARGEGKEAPGDTELLGLLQKMIKQRRESIELYDKGGRPELAAKEQEEIEIISAFLPKQLSEDETRSAIQEAIRETGAAGIQDMQKVVAALRAKYVGRMDFSKVAPLARKILAG